MASRSRGPLAPVKAIFHDVVPAQPREVPSWMQKGAGASSIPPETAAALLHAKGTRADPENDNTQYTAPEQAQQAYNPAEADPMLDARMQSAALASEASESWKPPEAQADPGPPQTGPALDELRQAISDLGQQRSVLLKQLEPQLLTLTRMIAERVLETTIPTDHELPHRLVKEGLQSLDHNGRVSIVLGPGFASEAANVQSRLEQDGIRCEVNVQEHLSSYACQVRTELGAVDESVETRLDTVLASIMDGEEAG